MTTILPQARTPWQVIDQAIGNQISQNLPGAVQQGYQRQLGLNALDQAQAEIAQANGDPMKIAMAFAKAGAQNPNLERALGPLLNVAMQQGQRGKGTKDFPAGGTSASGMPTRAVEGGKGEVPVSVSDLVQPRPSLVQNPQGTNDFQLPYGPEEISAARQKSRQLGYLPEMEERFVNDMLEYNKVAQNRRDVELQNYQQQQQQRRDTLENQRLFEKYLTEHTPEFSKNPDELELALKASEKYQNEPSFAARNEKIKNELRPYQAAKNALKKTLNRPLFGQTKEQRDLARPRAQMMVEMGQKPQLQLMIANGGSGEVEEADLLNPLPENLEKKLSSVPKFINPFEKVTNIDPDSEQYNEQLQKGAQARLKQKENITNYLSKEIKPGKDYSHPGTNLLLTRYHLIQKGMEWQEAAQTIDQAISEGKINLDPQQKIDYQKLAYPPLTGESYFDTIMNQLMFPITGKQ